jgi:hypothetical protein
MRTLGMTWAVSLLCLFAWAALASCDEIPTLENVVGPPALGFDSYGAGGRPSWSVAVDDVQVYAGAYAVVEVFTVAGDWVGFWPISSPVRGVGGESVSGYEGGATVSAIATSPWRWVYVADSNYAAVHIYDQQGDFLAGWGGFGDAPDEIPEEHYLRAISTSEDESVYVLEWGEWPERSGSIRRFTKEGTFLSSWSTPTAEWPRWCIAVDVDADATGSVWLLTRTWYVSGDIAGVAEARVHRYDVDGDELASWPVPIDTQHIEVEQGDYPDEVWALVNGPSRMLLCYERDGTLSGSFQVDSPWLSDFALDAHNDHYILALELIPGQHEHSEYASAFRIEKRTHWGNPSDTFCDYADMLARGGLIDPDGFAVTPQGETYAKINQLRPDFNYVSHFDAAGGLVEVLRTDEWPTYMPDTGAIEFLSRRYDVVDADGRCYLLEAVSEEIDDETLQWLVVATKHTREGEPIGSFTITAPVASSASWPAEKPSACLGADGDLRVMLAVGDVLMHDHDWEVIGTLWVAVVTPEGEVLNSWVDEGHERLGIRRANAVAVDPGGNVYVGLDGACWKYRPNGQRIGQIGAWGDGGDPDGEAASLVYSAGAIHVDETGRVRVLDSGQANSLGGFAANHILVFAHEPGPFSDVPYWHWAKDEVAAAVGAGIVFGYADGAYRPELVVARDQMAAFIARAVAGGDATVPDGPAQATFLDVPRTHWAFKYVEDCAAKGIVEGVMPHFYGPKMAVGRAQMAVFIARALVTPAGDAGVPDPVGDPTFPDVTSDSDYAWCRKHVEYIAGEGVCGGYDDDCYHPEYVCTRDQMAVYIARAFGLTG